MRYLVWESNWRKETEWVTEKIKDINKFTFIAYTYSIHTCLYAWLIFTNLCVWIFIVTVRTREIRTVGWTTISLSVFNC